MIKYNELLEEIQKHFCSLGFVPKKPASLISTTFPDTFNPSGGHDIVRKCLSLASPLKKQLKIFSIDPCFRHIDFDNIGVGSHSLLFEMQVYISSLPQSDLNKEEIIKVGFDLLTKTLGIKVEALIITYFAGGKIKGREFPADEETPIIWEKLGIKRSNLIGIRGPKNYLFLESDGEGAGPRSELLIKVTETNAPEQYLEIGTVIFEIHRFFKGDLEFSPNIVGGGGFGIERLLMAINKTNSIYETSVYKNAVASIATMLDNNIPIDLIKRDIWQLADVCKALSFALSEKIPIGNRGRGQRIKKLLKYFRLKSHLLDLPPNDVFKACFDQYQAIYNHRYPRLAESKESSIKIVDEWMQHHE
jgi:alanyl-tRNA synthetase